MADLLKNEAPDYGELEQKIKNGERNGGWGAIMDGWISGLVDCWMGGSMDEWINGLEDDWMNGLEDDWIGGGSPPGAGFVFLKLFINLFRRYDMVCKNPCRIVV